MMVAASGKGRAVTIPRDYISTVVTRNSAQTNDESHETRITDPGYGCLPKRDRHFGSFLPTRDEITADQTRSRSSTWFPGRKVELGSWWLGRHGESLSGRHPDQKRVIVKRGGTAMDCARKVEKVKHEADRQPRLLE
jgi:hypothetical protein